MSFPKESIDGRSRGFIIQNYFFTNLLVSDVFSFVKRMK